MEMKKQSSIQVLKLESNVHGRGDNMEKVDIYNKFREKTGDVKGRKTSGKMSR